MEEVTLNNPDLNQIENLVFEGGGVLGVAYVGALQALDEIGLLKNVKRFAGSSVGSIVAAALACQCSVHCLVEYFKKVDTSTFKDGGNFFKKVWRLYFKHGLYKGNVMMNWTRKLMSTDGKNPDITFQEVYDQYGTELVITGTPLNKQITEYFSKDTTPNMKVIDAVRISIGFPLVFHSIRRNGDIYIDGGLLDNYPIHVFDKDNYCHAEINNKTLGIKISSQKEINNKKPRITTLPSYVLAIADAVYVQSSRFYLRPNDFQRTIIINSADISPLHFDLTEDEKMFLFKRGVEAVTTFVSEHNTNT